MYLSIDFNSDIPIYEQIKRQMVEAIARGELLPGEDLPSVRQLGEDLGVNLHTINKSYKHLQNMGYVSMDRRIGTVVSTEFPDFSDKEWDCFESEMEFLISDWMNRGGTEDEIIDFIEKKIRAIKEGKNNG
ncbi:MAG: GntR family transcriptional regulator [Tissierellia bacterium]|nr:GntR family transcriptional regulator [Tissierellia bacterium]